MVKTKSNDFTAEKPSKFKVMAKILISAQLGVSLAAVIRFNYLLDNQVGLSILGHFCNLY